MPNVPLNALGPSLGEIYLAGEEARVRLAASEHRRAIEELQKRLGQEPENPDIYVQLAKHHKRLGDSRAGMAKLKEGLACCAPTRGLYRQALSMLCGCNRTREARTVARRGAELFPDDRMWFRLREALILPVLYDTAEEVATYRREFVTGLKEMLAGLKLDSQGARQKALEAIAAHSNFFLPYMGEDIREFQTDYGGFVHRIVAANYPEWVKPLKISPLPPGSRIRVGYISPNFRHHSESKSHMGWLCEQNHDEFEVFAFYIGRKVDAVTDEIRHASDHFYQMTGDLEDICKAILPSNLHIAVFLDHCDPTMAQLAALRLAPIQCTSWGRACTSGLPTVDYFLSSSLIEPEDGQDHYSERLVCLPGIGICYRKPVIPRALLVRRRGYYGLGENRTVYFCCQSEFKYLPQHDHVFVEIAKRLPSSQFVFRTHNDALRDDLLGRLKRAFAAEGLKAADYCVILRELPTHIDYWNLNLVSDVFLDALDYSGCVTTMEAIACGLPIVTAPGRFNRSRHSYAILTQLGVSETIAHDKKEYIDISVRLGQDRAWRAQIVERMKANHGLLFGDTRCVRALEEFYRQAVKEALAR
jgi:predicted O-linked N-acetylglucosamine transferase (SPINDLY family)